MNISLAAQVAKIKDEMAQAPKIFWNGASLGPQTERRQNTLLAYIDQLEKVIDGVVDDLEAIRTCSDEQIISDCAEAAQMKLCQVYDHEAYRARIK